MLMSLLVTMSLDAQAQQQPCVPRDIEELYLDARDELFAKRYGEAFQIIQDVVASVPCHERHLSPELISDIYQAGGVIAHHIGDEVLSGAWMDAAVRMAPLSPYDVSLGPELEGLHSEAVERVEGSPTVDLIAYEGVVFDGWPLIIGEHYSPHQGNHLVQRLSAEGVQTELVSLGGDETITLGPPPSIPEEPSSSSSPTGLLVSGGVLIGGGAALMTVGSNTFWRGAGEWGTPFAQAEDPTRTDTLRRYALICDGSGAVMIGLGTALLMRGASVHVSSNGAHFGIQRRW